MACGRGIKSERSHGGNLRPISPIDLTASSSAARQTGCTRVLAASECPLPTKAYRDSRNCQLDGLPSSLFVDPEAHYKWDVELVLYDSIHMSVGEVRWWAPRQHWFREFYPPLIDPRLAEDVHN